MLSNNSLFLHSIYYKMIGILNFLFYRYGDVVPTQIPGRILCYIWLLLSNIAIACFSATVTSILIADCFNSELTIEGSKVNIFNVLIPIFYGRNFFFSSQISFLRNERKSKIMLYFKLIVNFLYNFKEKFKIGRIHAIFRTIYSSSAKLNPHQNFLP